MDTDEHGLEIVSGEGKAVLKPPQSRRWRAGGTQSDRAKRLDCGVFTAAFGLEQTGNEPVNL